MAYIPSPWTGEGQGGGENALQPPPMLPLRLPPSPPFPATASAEGRRMKGGPFPASATAERPQFNGAASPARGGRGGRPRDAFIGFPGSAHAPGPFSTPPR